MFSKELIVRFSLSNRFSFRKLNSLMLFPTKLGKQRFEVFAIDLARRFVVFHERRTKQNKGEYGYYVPCFPFAGIQIAADFCYFFSVDLYVTK